MGLEGFRVQDWLLHSGTLVKAKSGWNELGAWAGGGTPASKKSNHLRNANEHAIPSRKSLANPATARTQRQLSEAIIKNTCGAISRQHP